jgi:hypothetical protein
LHDFGFAVAAGRSHHFSGTLRFAPTETLRSLVADKQSLIESKCWHDLESAVKLIMEVLLPRYAMPPRDLTVEKALAHWERIAHHTVLRYLQPLMDLARAGDQSGLVAELSKSVLSELEKLGIYKSARACSNCAGGMDPPCALQAASIYITSFIPVGPKGTRRWYTTALLPCNHPGRRRLTYRRLPRSAHAAVQTQPSQAPAKGRACRDAGESLCCG